MSVLTTEARILTELNFNGEQLRIYSALAGVPELHYLTAFTSMISTGTRVPGASWNGDDSQLAVKARIRPELYNEQDIRKVLEKAGLGDSIESFFYHPDTKIDGVKLNAGKSRGLVDNIDKEISHVVNLHFRDPI